MRCKEDRRVHRSNARNPVSATLSTIHSERIPNAHSRFAHEIMTTKPATIVVTLRLPAPIHALLKEAAKRDNRSMANMVHTLIVSHCVERGIGLDGPRRSGRRKA